MDICGVGRVAEEGRVQEFKSLSVQKDEGEHFTQRTLRTQSSQRRERLTTEVAEGRRGNGEVDSPQRTQRTQRETGQRKDGKRTRAESLRRKTKPGIGKFVALGHKSPP
jgi:hypothetical protein